MTKNISESKQDSSDTIYRRDALEALRQCHKHCINPFDSYHIDIEDAEARIRRVPPAQPEQDREFIKLTVRNLNGIPYYSIIYLEFDDNGVGHDFEGYSSYSLDVISDYLKEYFMPSVQSERKTWTWIDEGFYADGHGAHAYRCQKCGRHIIASEPDPFCRWCGAEMTGDDNDERRSYCKD